MVPQLYITVYKEQFASPGRAKRAQLRPTSAHRRNNPQPRPDFLFPRSLQPNYKSTLSQNRPPPPVDAGRPRFPPVRHLSFRSPVTTCPDNCLKKTAEAGKPQHMPPVHPAAEQALPSAAGVQALQLTEPPAAGAGLHPQRSPGYQRNDHPLSAQQLRQHAAAQLRTRPQTSSHPAAKLQLPLTQYRRFRSNSTLDYSGCYSCFHVVKPYQAGHYIIHPEFVSECLR